MLQLTIKDWKTHIDKQIQSGLYTPLTIDDKKTKEITNLEYCLIPQESITLVHNSNQEEFIERDYIVVNSFRVASFYLLQEKYSRRACFVNKYDGEDNHCLSYFHHYIRDNKYCMNVYIRSMNYLTNFIFDNQTCTIAYNTVYDLITKNYNTIDRGFIKVFIFSLHIIEG